MTEDFLHYIWKFQLLDIRNLKTIDGKTIVVSKPGVHNMDAGPDFFNAKVKIGKTTWAGNIEIHVNASDWKKHGHHKDTAYDNLILHAVFNDDAPVSNSKMKSIPTLDLSACVDLRIWEKYQLFLRSRTWIPCQNLLPKVDGFTISNWIDRLVVERLQRKAAEVDRLLKLTNNDWAEAFYIALVRNFGFKVNAEPFELLARSLPQKILAKHKDHLIQIEALLFGQAGFLDGSFRPKYPSELRKEYLFLKKKYQLKPVDNHLWKFLRLRPSNFPTVRLAQLSGLICQTSALFSKIINADSLNELSFLFEVKASTYWDTHYYFNKTSAKRVKRLGKGGIENLLINTVLPFMFVYGKQKANPRYCDRALALLEKLPAENNSIMKRWKDLDFEVDSAYRSQGLLELKNEYCSAKKCLNCSIGNRILDR